MKKLAAAFVTSGFVAVLVANSPARSSDEVTRIILERYPQADADGDGFLSDQEMAAVDRAVLRRYPHADVDGDGRLSDSEKESLLQNAGLTSPSHGANDESNDRSSPTPQESERSDSGSDFDSSSVRQGPRPIKPGRNGIGRQIPDVSFRDIAGNQYRLSDFAERKAVVFAMTGTGCPLCLKYSPSLSAIEKEYRAQDVAFVYVNPNESERGDRLRQAVGKHGFLGPYVSDGKKSISAILDARTTTEVFVLDQARTLVYRGAVDDQYGFAYSLDTPRMNYLTDALDAVLRAETPEIQATTSPGCELFYDHRDDSHTPIEITYHNRISRIVQANCLECHREGGIAPIALETYDQVRDYAGMMRSVVERGIMPPWFAASASDDDANESQPLHWANDRSLSDTEKTDLFRWFESNAPEGDPADAPLPKTFPGGWLIGQPDAVFEFPQPVPVKATGIMPYKNVTVETDLPEDKWVQAIEVRPGQLDVVHHVIVSVRTDEREFDERDGYWGAYVPGNSTFVYPSGYARLLPKGAKLRFQMHYTPNGTATTDSTRIGVIFAKEPPRHEVKVAGIANGRISIPPHAENHEEFADLRLPFDVQILSFLPHMHLRGKAARYEALTANGTQRLLDIPRYDFNWQLLYQLAEPLTLRRGDTIRFTAWFDNSENNPANPDPNRTVRWGQQTEDEMHLGYVEYIVPGAKPGEPMARLRTGRSARDRRGVSDRGGNADDDVNARIGNRQVRLPEIIAAFRKLDSDRDEKIIRSEVPGKLHKLFDGLDADRDQTLTIDEARESIRKYQNPNAAS